MDAECNLAANVMLDGKNFNISVEMAYVLCARRSAKSVPSKHFGELSSFLPFLPLAKLLGLNENIIQSIWKVLDKTDLDNDRILLPFPI